MRAVLDAPAHAQGLAPTRRKHSRPRPGGGRRMSGDQLNGIFQGAGVLPRDAVHYETAGDRAVGSRQPLRGGRVPRPPRGRPPGDGRDPVRAAPVRAGSARPQRAVQRRLRRPTRSTSATGSSGAIGRSAVHPGPGSGFVRPLDLLDARSAPGGSGRSSPRARRWRPTSPTRSCPAIGEQPPASTHRRCRPRGAPRAHAAGDGIAYERFILARRGRDWRPRSTRRCARGRWCTATAPVTVTGRVVADGAKDRRPGGEGGLAAVLRAGARPDPDDQARRCPGPRRSRTRRAIQVKLPPNRSYRVQPYAFGLPAAPPTSFAVARAGRRTSATCRCRVRAARRDGRVDARQAPRRTRSW